MQAGLVRQVGSGTQTRVDQPPAQQLLRSLAFQVVEVASRPRGRDVGGQPMAAPVLAIQAQTTPLAPAQQLMHAAFQVNQGLIPAQAPFASPLLHLQAEHLQTAAAVATHHRLGALQVGRRAIASTQPQQGIQRSQYLH